MKEITSTKNDTYKYIKSLQTKKARMKNRQYTIEGIKSVRDAISAGADIDFIAAVPTAIPILAVYEEGGRLVDVDFEKDADGEGSVELSADYSDGNVAKIFVWEAFDKPVRSKVLDITSAID